MKECVTHHHACDCREAKIKLVAETLLAAHDAYVYCNGSSVSCQCEACQAARELIGGTMTSNVTDDRQEGVEGWSKGECAYSPTGWAWYHYANETDIYGGCTCQPCDPPSKEAP
jgi:hypothetical protein